MRDWLRTHGAASGAFVALLGVAALLSVAMPVPGAPADSGSPLPVQAIPLPAPGDDDDNDTYADAVDLTPGDAQATVRLQALDLANADAEPYVLLGTQDDQWRTGLGAELEWRHVVDPDSLGHKAGSPAWQRSVLRTGAWWMSRPGEGLDTAVARSHHLETTGWAGAHWPQTLRANIRDDRPVVVLDVALFDAASSPHHAAGQWHVQVDVVGRQARAPDGPWMALPATLRLQDDRASLETVVDLATGLGAADAQALATRWAPTLHFDSQEAFFPVRGDLLEQYHGFARPGPGDADLRTWDPGFNAGRDAYRLFLADFTGDGATDRLDAQALTGILSASAIGAPTVYARVDWAADDQVVVQYWFLYLYNFVLDDAGAEIAHLAHKGDREAVQLTFPSLEAARNGTPSAIAFSQHYEGLLVEAPDPGLLPLQDGQLVVHVARGSHASYPHPGDDRRLRSSLTSLFDRFDGLGRTLQPANYTLELLAGQPWHAGYNWGPVTRYGRDLGVASKPLLQHDFRYPFTDPLWWQAGLRTASPDDFDAMYGGPP